MKISTVFANAFQKTSRNVKVKNVLKIIEKGLDMFFRLSSMSALENYEETTISNRNLLMAWDVYPPLPKTFHMLKYDKAELVFPFLRPTGEL